MSFDEEITTLAQDIVRSKKIVALSGAGMSVESDIASFRGKGGLWEKYDPEEYAHISTLRHHPEKAWILLGAMQKEIARAKPNQGHYALAELEQLGFLKTIITQNVDGLHHLAGNRDVIEFHGNLQTVTCMDCGHHLSSSEISLDRHTAALQQMQGRVQAGLHILRRGHPGRCSYPGSPGIADL